MKRLAKQYGKTTDEVGSAIKAFNSLNKIYFAVSENQEYMNDLSEEYIQFQKDMGYVSSDVSTDMLNDTRDVLDGITTGIHSTNNSMEVFADKVVEGSTEVVTAMNTAGKAVENLGERTGQVSQNIAGMDFSIDVNTDEGKAKIEELDKLLNETEKSRTTDVEANTTPAINTLQRFTPAANSYLSGLSADVKLNSTTALDKAWRLKADIESALKGINIGLEVKLNAKVKDTIAAGFNAGLALKQMVGEIKAYKAGGFPEDGLFFANHNELVGKFSNGNTAVANNEQILTGIENATSRGILGGLAAVNLRSSMAAPPPLAMTSKYSANENEIKQMIQEVVSQGSTGSGYTKEMVAVLKELLQLIRELDLDIVIDGKKLKDIIVDRINEHTQQTGVCEIQV